MKFTSAKEVISYLYSLPHLHPKNDLSFIKRVLQQLGNPQDHVKTIHVTGTNGKGSTSYYLANLLKKAGQKTGLFVSPYIYQFNERIQLDNQNISDENLVTVANKVQTAYEKIKQIDDNFSLVTFEYEVAMTFVYFEQENCDYAVIEVGIGGEHDKTNVIVPEVSIITTVGLDHEKIIGPTLQDIAKEKSGVIKKDRPVVLGNVPKSVLPILLNKAAKGSAPVLCLNQDFKIKTINKALKYSDAKLTFTFDFRPKVESYDIAVAVQAFLLLNLKLSNQAIQAAINQTHIPGRYHVLQKEPLIILDGAHNIQAMANLLEIVHTQAAKKHGQVHILVTMMKDKDLAQVFNLFDNNDDVLLTTLDYPRAAKKKDFPLAIQKRYNYEDDYRLAFAKLKKKMTTNDILLVTGSFYLVSAILNWKGKGNAS